MLHVIIDIIIILVSYWRSMDITMACKIDSKGSCHHIKSDRIPSDSVTKMHRHMTSTIFDFRLCSPMTFASSSSTTTIILQCAFRVFLLKQEVELHGMSYTASPCFMNNAIQLQHFDRIGLILRQISQIHILRFECFEQWALHCKREYTTFRNSHVNFIS